MLTTKKSLENTISVSYLQMQNFEITIIMVHSYVYISIGESLAL